MVVVADRTIAATAAAGDGVKPAIITSRNCSGCGRSGVMAGRSSESFLGENSRNYERLRGE